MSGTTIGGHYLSGIALTEAAYNPVLVTGTITVGSGIALYGGGDTTIGGTIVPIAWTVTNEGLLRSQGAGSSGGYGVLLAGGGSVTNQSTATIYGYQGGVRITGGAGTVVNAGTIVGSGSGADAVGLAAGYANTVVVDPGAVFLGTVDGGNALGATNTLGAPVVSTLELASADAAGTLAGLGTQFVDFGQISVDTGATWTLTSDAIGQGYVVYDAGTLTNTGSIGSNVTLAANAMLTNNGSIGAYVTVGAGAVLINTGSIGYEVTLAANAVLTNTSSGAITGIFAVYGASGNVTVTNAGSLGGEPFGVRLKDGGTVMNLGGTITADALIGTGVALADTVVNDGLISGPEYGVYGASSVTNQAAGTIIGGDGVKLPSGSLLNAGYIRADAAYGIGVVLQSDAAVTNQLGGTITATALGINMSADAGTVVNYGLISAGDYGVDRAEMVTNHGTVTIAGISYGPGTITGGKAGINVAAASGAVVNAGIVAGTGASSTGILLQNGGSVSNESGGVITGANFGVNVSGGVGTVQNAGYIGGLLDAVSFDTGFANRLIVDPGATFDGSVYGGGAASTLELASGASVGMVYGLGSQYLSFGQVIVDAGASWMLTGDNDLAVGVTLDAGARLEIAGTVASDENIVFAGNGAELVIDGRASMAGSVTGFGQGDTIDLGGVTYTSVSYAAGQLNYTPPGGGSASSFPLELAAPGTIYPVSDGAGGTEITALCFCAGTKLATPDGEVRVERLAVGDLVLTASGATRPILWIGVGRVLAAQGRRSAATPVIVRKGALAENVPYYDLHVTKGHAFWFDGVLIPVEFLVNHRSIMWDDRAREVTLYHVELDRHDVVLANGAPAESYRDDGNRWLFTNANSGWDLPPLPPCAPVLTGGPVVDAVWRRLLDRAGPRPGVPLTDDPDLHLVADGERVDVAWRRGAARLFHLPARPDCVRPGSVRVVSRIGVPQEIGWARDPRPLGVALRHLVIRQGARLVVTEADDKRLTQGFHEFEQDIGVRWTDGDALLPAALFDGFDGPLELELHLGGTTQYLADAAVLAA